MKNAKDILTSHKKFHINIGLERISKIMEILGNPPEKYKIIHIAGTNGKGSTSKIINEILVKANKKTGLFTSPHLFEYEERIKINNQNISKTLFNKLINKIDSLAKENSIELSEFELINATAFYYFYIMQVEYVVLEVGLGGLFDSTNIIKKPLIEVITTIDFDHTERLGSSIEEIALQKAGIIKDNSKVVISKENKGFEIVKNYAKEKQAKILYPKTIETIFENNKNYAILNNQKVPFNLLGKHQGQNLALAIEAIKNLDFEVDNSILKNALNEVKWNFRLEYIQEKNILIDGAHNPNGIKILRNFLDEHFKNNKKTFIFGCLKNKNYSEMLDILLKEEDEFYFYEFNYPNALKFNELDTKYQARKISSTKEIETIINENKNLKIFCGSLYMLGNIFKEIEL